MKPINFAQARRDYDRIEKAITYIEEARTPDLKEISGHVGLSEFHFQHLCSAAGSASAPSGFCSFSPRNT